MLRFARNDVKGRFRVKLGMMYEKEMPRQAEHDKLVKNWRNKRNSVQGECRDNQTSLICHDRAKLNALKEGQYRFLEWQKMTLAVFVAKKRPKTAKPAPADRF